jgi:hypothetical protein
VATFAVVIADQLDVFPNHVATDGEITGFWIVSLLDSATNVAGHRAPARAALLTKRSLIAKSTTGSG